MHVDITCINEVERKEKAKSREMSMRHVEKFTRVGGSAFPAETHKHYGVHPTAIVSELLDVSFNLRV